MDLNKWKKISINHKYFKTQLTKPKESTKEALKIFQYLKLNNLKTIDLACGNGANLTFLKKKYKNKKYCLGIDFNKKLIKKALKNKDYHDLDFQYGNILNLKKSLANKFQLVTSFQTLSWMEDYTRAVNEMIKLRSDYIFISSLFWEGLIDFKIQVKELKDKSYKRRLVDSSYYNIYSINNFINLFKHKKYKLFFCKKFEIKKKIKKDQKNKMGTYTIKNKKKFIQISGPLIMNWYFIIFKKL